MRDSREARSLSALTRYLSRPSLQVQLIFALIKYYRYHYHNLTVPSHPHVATRFESHGCHSTPTVASRWLSSTLKFLQVLKSQKNRRPFQSPETTSFPSLENETPHVQPVFIWPQKFFFLFDRKVPSFHSQITTRLSEDWPAKYFPSGCMEVYVIACISGQLMCLMTTGTPNSHKNTFLSSLVLTNLRQSTKVSVLTALRCQSQESSTLEVRMSIWWMCFEESPAKKELCFQNQQFSLTQQGMLFILKHCATLPVSVSHCSTVPSYEHEMKKLPSFENCTSRTPALWPVQLRVSYRSLAMSNSLIWPQMFPASKQCPNFGKNLIHMKPDLEAHCQALVQPFGMKHLDFLIWQSLGGSMYLRPLQSQSLVRKNQVLQSNYLGGIVLSYQTFCFLRSSNSFSSLSCYSLIGWLFRSQPSQPDHGSFPTRMAFSFFWKELPRWMSCSYLSSWGSYQVSRQPSSMR